MHLPEYPCSYEECSEIFRSRKDLLIHEKKEHRVKCELCSDTSPSTFKTIQQLKAHIRIVHEKTKRHNVHFCHVCNLSFPSKTEYELHQVKTHRSQGSGFVLHNTAMQGDHVDYRSVNFRCLYFFQLLQSLVKKDFKKSSS